MKDHILSSMHSAPHDKQAVRLVMTDWLTTKSRHRNERLTILLAASNKRHHSCPRHRCFKKFLSHQLGLSWHCLCLASRGKTFLELMKTVKLALKMSVFSRKLPVCECFAKLLCSSKYSWCVCGWFKQNHFRTSLHKHLRNTPAKVNFSVAIIVQKLCSEQTNHPVSLGWFSSMVIERMLEGWTTFQCQSLWKNYERDHRYVVISSDESYIVPLKWPPVDFDR